MSAIPEAELKREGRRVLRKLADTKARLQRLANGSWTIVQRGDRDSGRMRIAANVVKAFRERGWVDTAGGEALCLSAGGQSWLIAEMSGIDSAAAQHQLLGLRRVQNEHGIEDLVVVNQAESPLAWLHARGAIEDVQFEAGERLRRDYTLAQLEPRLCTDLSAPVVLGGSGPKAAFISDTVLAAKQRLSKALGAVGPGLSDLLFDVCCALKGLEATEKEKSWPRRSGKVVLMLALDRLADHYGLRPAPASSRLRSWSADNLEPARPI